MKQNEFSPLHVNNLRIDDLYGIVKTTIEISSLVKDDIGELAKAALGKLEIVNTELEARMKKILGSALTPELQDLNTKRNKLFSEIKRFVSTACKSSSATLKPAGTALKTFFDPYWHTDTEPLNTITSIYEEMFDRFHTQGALQADVNTLGITEQMIEMEALNADFDSLYKERNIEISSKTGSSASEIKSDAIQAYEQYCTAIEQSVNLIRNDTLNQLFSEMDGLRRKYALIKPKTRKDTDVITN